YRKALNEGETVYEIFFTDDDQMYIIASSLGTDFAPPAYTLECGYSIENGSMHWAETGGNASVSDGIAEIQARPDRIILSVKGGSGNRKLTLTKISDTVPLEYTLEGKEQIVDEAAASEQETREGIISFAAELSDKTGLPIELNEDEQFQLTVYPGVQFASDGANFYISPAENTYMLGDNDYYIDVPDGAMYTSVPCFVIGEYAIIFDSYSGEAPLAWQSALEQLQAE
ncbi:hypothetical protein LJC56_12075, partial [Christensenellaceae bacterium OttesenSCG-928-K19]|nr:hypothetical protein [Christensenellaceae bacterium OttesenSCG-928-K19]